MISHPAAGMAQVPGLGHNPRTEKVPVLCILHPPALHNPPHVECIFTTQGQEHTGPPLTAGIFSVERYRTALYEYIGRN